MRGLWVCQFILLIAVGASTPSLFSDPVPVRHPQGSAHGFLEIRTVAGVRIAVGDYSQTVHGGLLTCHVAFHFYDGSIDEETTMFTQHSVYRLLNYHHIQRGPSFPNPINLSINARTGQITFHTADGKSEVENLDIPADLANGLPPNLLLDIPPSIPVTTVSYLIATSKPRLIHITMKPADEVHFLVGGVPRKAIDYSLHIELGGIIGVVAPMIGKQPKDFHIWIMQDKMPAFIREEGQFYEGGPVWRVQQISPVFPQ